MPKLPSKIMPVEHIAQSILILRGQKVMTDEDLAHLYGVSIKALNQAVKRNLIRFPADFMFHLTNQEVAALRSQICDLELAPRLNFTDTSDVRPI